MPFPAFVKHISHADDLSQVKLIAVSIEEDKANMILIKQIVV